MGFGRGCEGWVWFVCRIGRVDCLCGYEGLGEWVWIMDWRGACSCARRRVYAPWGECSFGTTRLLIGFRHGSPDGEDRDTVVFRDPNTLQLLFNV